MNTFQVRDARPDDAQTLIHLRQKIFAETPFMLYGAGEYDFPAEQVREQLRRILASGCSRSLVAEASDALIGFLGVAGSSMPRLRHSATIALGVLKEHWGKGVGTALLTEVLRWAPGAGLSRLELHVMKNNPRGVELYQRLGFRIEGERRRAYIVDGASIDDFLMAYVYDT